MNDDKLKAIAFRCNGYFPGNKPLVQGIYPYIIKKKGKAHTRPTGGYYLRG